MVLKKTSNSKGSKSLLSRFGLLIDHEGLETCRVEQLSVIINAQSILALLLLQGMDY